MKSTYLHVFNSWAFSYTNHSIQFSMEVNMRQGIEVQLTSNCCLWMLLSPYR